MKKKLIVLLMSVVCVLSMAIGCTNLESNLPQIPEFQGSYQTVNAFLTDEITVPDVTFTGGATLTVEVNDPNGGAVQIVDNKFTVTTVGTYVITYKIELGGLQNEMQINVSVVENTTKPTITLDGENVTTVLLGEDVTLVSATAADAIGNAIDVTVTVTDAQATEVVITDNKFTATVLGDYTVTYATTDKYGNATEIVNTVNCYKLPDIVAPVPENVKNSFENEDESYIERLNKETAAYTVERNTSDENVKGVRSGAYSLKISAVSGGTFNIVSEVFTGNNDLSDIATISIWVYNPLEINCGFSIYKIILKNGNSVTVNKYAVIKAGEWAEYTVNLMETGLTEEQLEKTYSIQIWSETAFTEAYIDDISYDLRSDYPVIGEVEESVIAKLNAEYTIAVPTVSEGTDLSYTITDEDGNEVTVTDGKWTPSVGGIYTLTYTATKNGHTANATTTITVADKPVITINGENKSIVTVEDEVTVATATAKDFFNNDITVVTTVTDANGDEVTLTDGKFTANVIGTYTVKYYTVDENGNENEITVTIECKPVPVSKGDVPENVVNSFETVEECYLELLDKNSSGYDVFQNSTNDNADGVRSGAYSLKVVLTGSGNFNLLSEVITGNNDLSDIANLSFWAYNPKDTAQGMSIYSVVFKNGTSVKTEVYKSIPAKSWYEFKYDYLNSTAVTEEQMGSVFSINLWGINEIYIDDISYDLRSDYPDDPVSKGDVPENVANSFETLEECYLDELDAASSSFNVFQNSTNDNADGVRSGAYSLKVVFDSGSGNFNLLSEVITGSKDLSDIASLSFWVYNPKDTAQGMSIFKTVFVNGTAVSTEVYKSIPAKSWYEFKYDYLNSTAVTKEQMASVFAIQLWGIKEIYIDDISYDLRSDYPSDPVSKGDVPENVANSFETLEECYLELLDKNSSGYDVFQNSTNDNADGVRSGAYSLKVVLTGSGNFNLLSEVITGSKDLSDIASLSFWVYNPKDTAQGMSIFKTVFVNGTAVSTEVYKSIPAKSWYEFKYDYLNSTAVTKEQMASVFAIQLWGVNEIYIDDISYDLRSNYKDPEPENTALSLEAWAGVTGTNVTVNTDSEYVIDGAHSLRLELINGSGGWSRAQVSNWGKGITFTEDYNAITFSVYAIKATNVSFIIGTGNSTYSGQGYSKLIALSEGWNTVTICIDTDMSGKAIAIKDGIVFFGAQAVNTSYVSGDPNGSAINNDGAILYVDAVLAINVRIPDPEPENTAISFESFGAGFTATNIEMNTDPEYVKDGTLSLKMTLTDSGKWSYAAYSRWQTGITFTEDYNAIKLSIYATKAVRVCFCIGTGGNAGSAAYSGDNYTKGYSLVEGWNEIIINFDTDVSGNASVKEGIVKFAAQAVKDDFVGPADSNSAAISNSGAILYVDAVVAISVETPDPEPENTALSLEAWAGVTGTNVTVNTDIEYIIDGTHSLKLELINGSGGWSRAQVSNWGKGITFTEDYNAITFSVYATKATNVSFIIGTGNSTYSGQGYSKLIALNEGWNTVTICIDTDMSGKAIAIKDGIVFFGAQAVNTSYVSGDPNGSAINNDGAILYVDAVVATKIDA